MQRTDSGSPHLIPTPMRAAGPLPSARVLAIVAVALFASLPGWTNPLLKAVTRDAVIGAVPVGEKAPPRAPATLIAGVLPPVNADAAARARKAR